MGVSQIKGSKWERKERKREMKGNVLFIKYADTDLVVSQSCEMKCNQNTSLFLGLSSAF